MGQEGIGLRRKVDEAQDALDKAAGALNTARSALQGLVPQGLTTDQFRALQKDDNVDQHIAEATTELENANRAKRNADAIRQRTPLLALAPAGLPDELGGLLAATLDDIALQAEEQVRQHLTRHTQGIGLDWIRQGFEGRKGTTCPYCGQDMCGLDILEVYLSFFSGALQQQQAGLQRALRTVESNFGQSAQQRLRQVLQGHATEEEWWRDAVGFRFDLPTLLPAEHVSTAMEEARKALVGALQRKQGQPGTSVTLTDAEQAALTVWQRTATEVENYMGALAPINAAIAERQRAAGSTDASGLEARLAQLNAQKRRHENDVVDAFSTYHAALAAKATKEREKTDANKALREQSEQVLREYGESINAFLGKFCTDFRITGAGVSFRGGQPAGELGLEILGTRVSATPEDAATPGKPSLANTLSSGDRSTLALAFFLAVAEKDERLGDAVVVFDDPFHSQDRSRRRRTIESIGTVASRCGQCFVLSHDLDFAREAAQVGGADVRTFALDVLQTPCLLKAASLPALAAPAYDQDYARLTSFLAQPVGDPAELRATARCIRPVLEGYLRAKFPGDFGEKEWLGHMVGKISVAPAGSALACIARFARELGQICDYSKVFHHDLSAQAADTATVDANELKSYIQQALGIVHG
jgi:wobble nucleotide-excising tRNase